MSMLRNQVYRYESPQQFLLDCLDERQKQDPAFSVRRWAQSMGLKSHSLLVMILQGKRKLRIQHCDFLVKGIPMDANELAYFKTLIQYDNSSSFEEKSLITQHLNKLHPGEGFSSIEVDNFKVISNWIYMAIMAMTELKVFRGTEEEIVELLDGKSTIAEVRAALTRLIDMKLLERDSEGFLRATHKRVSTTDDVRNEGAREYHKQVGQLALDAILEQDILVREFQSFTMAVSKDKLGLAKEMIRSFRSQLSKAVSGDGDNVYQTNIQFFQLTQDLAPQAKTGHVAMDETK